MLPAIGAASSALDALLSLGAKKPTPAASSAQNRQMPDLFGSTGSSSATKKAAGSSSQSGALSPELLSALLAALGQANSPNGAPDGASSAGGSNPLKDLFSQIDADGDGKLSKSEFENSLGAGGTNTAQADDAFSKMDKDGDGSVSLDEMMSTLKGRGHRHQAAETGESRSGPETPAESLQGATTTTVTNSDGSTTTSLTYADGSKVTMTSPAASGAATSSYNFIEQMIARQAKAVSAAAGGSLSVSA
jgi:hypothetical protein